MCSCVILQIDLLIEFLRITDDDSLFSSELHVANKIVTWTSALVERPHQNGRPQRRLCRAGNVMQQIVGKTNKIDSANILRGDAGQASLNKACKAKQSRNCQGKE